MPILTVIVRIKPLAPQSSVDLVSRFLDEAGVLVKNSQSVKLLAVNSSETTVLTIFRFSTTLTDNEVPAL